MAIAVVCALFAQWQAGRSVEAPLKDAEANAVTLARAPMLDTVIKPGRTPRTSAVGTLVRTSATLNTDHFWVVANRIQENGTRGYWVIGTYSDQAGNKFVAPLGFTSDRTNALAVAKRMTGLVVDQMLAPMHGRLSPSEGPQAIAPVLQSLSLGQLANLLPTDAGKRVYPLFLLVTNQAAESLERITVTSLNQTQINWLSAFYAAEWTAFCGFSFFMWWRLVRDQQQRERGQL
jgi:hypothetical protein